MTRTESAEAFPTRTHVEAALRVSLQSVAWTVVSSTIAIVIGVVSSTLVLVALGAIGYVDGIGSVTLAAHFRDALEQETLSERLERIAHTVVLVCLALVGAAAAAIGTLRLVRGEGSSGSVAGGVLAAISVVVLLALSLRKQRIAVEVASPALRSDGHLSAVGAAEAAVAVLGILATRLFSWTTADAAATVLVGLGAVALALTTWIRKE